MKNVIFRLKM